MKNKKIVRLVATDLDGTFLRNDKTISEDNLTALELLGERGVLRVVATGRNLQKTQEVISPNVPFDYIVFSSGAGIYDWKNKKLLSFLNIQKDVVRLVTEFLLAQDCGFFLFQPVPDNAYCWYYRGSEHNSEFEAYLDYHRPFAIALPENTKIDSDACQFLIIFRDEIDHYNQLYLEISHHFPELKIVRASSPLDTGYIWMEIFHPEVSKGEGVKFICDLLQIDHQHTLGIGNDFNDHDLLKFTNYSYIVENGPMELKKLFKIAPSNEENAFAFAVKRHL
jgi:hypothetical protein